MGAFDKYSNKPDNAPFLGVTFGFGKPLLEVELNEAQQIQNDKMISLMGIRGDCVIDRDGFSYDGTTLTVNTKIVKDGIMINTAGATLALTNGESAYISSEIVDYAYSDTIRANGNTSGAVIKNSLIDDSVNIETSRRKGYKFTINKNSGMLLGTVIGGKFICLASDYVSGICRYIGTSISAKSKKGGLKLNRLYGRSEQNGTPTPDAPIAIKSVVNPKVTVTGNNKEKQGASLKYTLNALPVSSGGNVTINGKQYISDYVDFDKKQLARMVETVDLSTLGHSGSSVLGNTVRHTLKLNKKSVGTEAIAYCNRLRYTADYTLDSLHFYISSDDAIVFLNSDETTIESGKYIVNYALATPTTIDLTDEEVAHFLELKSYSPVSNVSTSSKELSPIVDFEISSTEVGAKSLESENNIRKTAQEDEGKRIYGIAIDKNDSNPKTRCKYLEDAVGMTPAYMNYTTGKFNYGDWGDVWFVKDNFPCMVKSSGEIDYKLNPNDYSKKEDGTASDVANTSYDGNAMSAMPLVWIRQYESGGLQYIYLANYKVNDEYHAYAHEKEDGTIRDYIFMSIFKGSLVESKLRSISGLQPMHTKTASQEISYAKANGEAWYTKTWAQRNLMICLLTMMFCSTNSQEALGNGNLNYDSSSDNPTHGVLQTGTLNTNGQFWGANDNTHQVKAFHQEAVWGDQWDRIAGLINDNGTIKVKMVAPYNLTGEGYESTGKTPSGTSGGYISETFMSELGMIPIKATGSATTFECDGLWFNNTIVAIAHVGGHCSVSSRCGVLCVSLYGAASAAHWHIGASLSS